MIVLTAIFPRNDNLAVMPAITQINARLARIADGTKVRFLNINSDVRRCDRSLYPQELASQLLTVQLSGSGGPQVDVES